MSLKNLASNKIILQIKELSKNLKIKSYAVGGCVRDSILNRANKDIDIVTVGDCIPLIENFASLNKNKEVHIFKNFGTAMVKLDNCDVEFVSARKESYQENSRKPFVENGTLYDDLSRRDFTINALAFSLNGESFGEIIDLFDGINDLKKKIIRTPLPPEVTFSDDPLRMMRAVRFSTLLNFKIDTSTKNAIKKKSDRLSIVSQERITTELNKIILSEKPSRGFFLLDELNLLEQFFPEIILLKGKEVIGEFSHKDNFIHTLQVLDNVSEKSNDLWLRWAAILHDIAKSQTKKFDEKIGFSFHGHEFLGAKMVPQIFKKLKLPTSEPMTFVKKLVQLHLRPIVLANDFVTDSAVRRLIYDAGHDLENLILLCRADITTSNDEKKKKYLNNFDIIEKKISEIEKKDNLRNFKPVITGDIIMKAFNLSPCAEVGRIKSKVRDAIIDGVIPNAYKEAFEFMMREFFVFKK